MRSITIYTSLLGAFLCVFFSCSSQTQISKRYTNKEFSYSNLFYGFTGYLKKALQNNTDITDSSQLKYVLTHYTFIDAKLDTTDSMHLLPGEISLDQINSFRKQLSALYQYLLERNNQKLCENLTAIPIRLSSDTFIYNRLTTFQKENTFVFYDKRYPKKTIGYILFISPNNNAMSSPKIWSWTLIYKFGKFVFKSVTGEEGYEYIFKK